MTLSQLVDESVAKKYKEVLPDKIGLTSSYQSFPNSWEMSLLTITKIS